MDDIKTTALQFARQELQRMAIDFNALSLIRDKDGVSVWRVTLQEGSVVLKCFENPEYRREIANYHLLGRLGIPTLKLVAGTDCAFVMEDIECSHLRLATAEDVKNPAVAKEIARWYKALHQKGREHATSHAMFNESDEITVENIREIKEKTQTSGNPIWALVEENLEKIRNGAANLPKTLNYNDFFYTNLAVARDGSSALMFDYNLLGRGYVYSDIRNVCSSLGSQEATDAFLAEYGHFDQKEKLVDDVADAIYSLHVACGREVFPHWAADVLEQVKDGTLQLAVEKLLKSL